MTIGHDVTTSKRGYFGWDQTANKFILGKVGTSDLIRLAPATVEFPQFSTSGVLHTDTVGNITSSTLVNADVSSSAAIAYSKLNLASSILTTDIAASAVQNANIGNGQVDPIKTSFMDSMGSINSNGTISYSYGIASSTKNSTGNYTITFNTTASQRVTTITPTGIGFNWGISGTSSTSVTISFSVAGTPSDCSFFLISVIFT
jgi:hypothetical protein